MPLTLHLSDSPAETAIIAHSILGVRGIIMNWTGGKLQQFSSRRGTGIAKRQREYFAKQRSQRKRGRSSSPPFEPSFLNVDANGEGKVPSYAGHQRHERFTRQRRLDEYETTAPLIRRLDSMRNKKRQPTQSLEYQSTTSNAGGIRNAISISSSSTSSSQGSGPTRETCKGKASYEYSQQSPGDSTDNDFKAIFLSKRQQLLKVEDWADLQHRHPAHVEFLSGEEREKFGKRRRISTPKKNLALASLPTYGPAVGQNHTSGPLQPNKYLMSGALPRKEESIDIKIGDDVRSSAEELSVTRSGTVASAGFRSSTKSQVSEIHCGSHKWKEGTSPLSVSLGNGRREIDWENIGLQETSNIENYVTSLDCEIDHDNSERHLGLRDDDELSDFRHPASMAQQYQQRRLSQVPRTLPSGSIDSRIEHLHRLPQVAISTLNPSRIVGLDMTSSTPFLCADRMRPPSKQSLPMPEGHKWNISPFDDIFRLASPSASRHATGIPGPGNDCEKPRSRLPVSIACAAAGQGGAGEQARAQNLLSSAGNLSAVVERENAETAGLRCTFDIAGADVSAAVQTKNEAIELEAVPASTDTLMHMTLRLSQESVHHEACATAGDDDAWKNFVFGDNLSGSTDWDADVHDRIAARSTQVEPSISSPRSTSSGIKNRLQDAYSGTGGATQASTEKSKISSSTDDSRRSNMTEGFGKQAEVSFSTDAPKPTSWASSASEASPLISSPCLVESLYRQKLHDGSTMATPRDGSSSAKASVDNPAHLLSAAKHSTGIAGRRIIFKRPLPFVRNQRPVSRFGNHASGVATGKRRSTGTPKARLPPAHIG
jgi:hypothetical protein